MIMIRYEKNYVKNSENLLLKCLRKKKFNI